MNVGGSKFTRLPSFTAQGTDGSASTAGILKTSGSPTKELSGASMFKAAGKAVMAMHTFAAKLDSIDEGDTSELKQISGNIIADEAQHDFRVGQDDGFNNVSVWAGSTAAESDRDYIAQGTKGNGGVERSSSDNQTAFVNKLQVLIESTKGKSLEGCIEDVGGDWGDEGIPDPPQCRKLTEELRENAISLLKDNGLNWFKTLDTLNTHVKSNPADANFCAQLKYDIRQLQTDIMAGMDKAIDGDYSAINETEMVRVKNEMCGEIFGGREAGTVFDTNLYTGHMALSKGLNFDNPETKERWLDQNQENSMIKRAQQYDTVFPDNPKDSWDSYVEKQLEGLPDDKKAKLQTQYDSAWSRKETRAHNIQAKIDTIKAGRTKPDGIEQKYFDQEVELSAMNRLYEDALLVVERTLSDLKELEAEITQLNNNNDISTELKETFLEMKNKQLQETQADVIEAQSNALLYANEPYYAQVTIVNIVAGTQMKMPDSFMTDEKNQDVRQEAWQTKLETDFSVLTVDEGKVIASNENFADLVKGKHEWPYEGHHVKEDSKPADNVNYHFKKASKYAHRALMLLPQPTGDGSAKDAFLSKANNMLKTVDIIYAVRQGPPGTEFKSENGTSFNDSINVMQQSKELQEFAGKEKPLTAMGPVELADTFHSFMESLEAESKKHF